MHVMGYLLDDFHIICEVPRHDNEFQWQQHLLNAFSLSVCETIVSTKEYSALAAAT